MAVRERRPGLRGPDLDDLIAQRQEQAEQQRAASHIVKTCAVQVPGDGPTGGRPGPRHQRPHPQT
jgi:hypothetical protein